MKAVACALALLVLATPAHGEELPEIPSPVLAGVEPAVAAQLAEARAAVAAVVAAADASPLDRAEAYGNLARLYAAYRLEEPARAAFEQARRQSPADPRWPRLLGRLLHDEGRPGEAIPLYREALERVPGDAALQVYLGEAQLEEGLLEEAAAAFRAALELAPGLPAAQARLGETLLAAGDAAAAVPLLEAALAAVPGADRLHYPLGLAHRALGDREAAERHLGHAGVVGIRPPDPLLDRQPELLAGSRLHLLRGRTAFHAGRHGEAAEAFARAVEAQPGDVPALVGLAAALAELDRGAEAAAALRRALAHDEGNPVAHFNLGKLLLLRDAPAEAAPHLRRATAASPGDAEAHLLLARALHATDEPEAALSAVDRAAAVAPADQEAAILRAEILGRLGRWGEATDHLAAAHEAVPEAPAVTLALARLLAAAPDVAARDGQRALELASGLWEAQPTLRRGEVAALALAELGRCEEAARLQESLVQAATEAVPAEVRQALAAALDRYRAGPPCRP